MSHELAHEALARAQTVSFIEEIIGGDPWVTSMLARGESLYLITFSTDDIRQEVALTAEPIDETDLGHVHEPGLQIKHWTGPVIKLTNKRIVYFLNGRLDDFEQVLTIYLPTSKMVLIHDSQSPYPYAFRHAQEPEPAS